MKDVATNKEVCLLAGKRLTLALRCRILEDQLRIRNQEVTFWRERSFHFETLCTKREMEIKRLAEIISGSPGE